MRSILELLFDPRRYGDHPGRNRWVGEIGQARRSAREDGEATQARSIVADDEDIREQKRLRRLRERHPDAVEWELDYDDTGRARRSKDALELPTALGGGGGLMGRITEDGFFRLRTKRSYRGEYDGEDE